MKRYALLGLMLLSAVASADASETLPHFRYVAMIGGACERLTLADRDATRGCHDELMNVDFGDGRVAFAFTSPAPTGPVITTFFGHASTQPDRRNYDLEIDSLSTVTTGPSGKPETTMEAASGHCAMRGDPTRESARFECSATRGTRQTSGTFVSAGAPTVYAGTRGGSVAMAAESAQPLE